MKNILIAMFTICFLASCSKDDDVATVPDPKTFQYRVKEFKDTYYRYELEYNNNNQLTKYISVNNSYFSYENVYNSVGFLIEYKGSGNYKEVYVRDSNGLLLEKIYQNATPNSKTVYTYDATGNKIEEKNYDYVNGSYVYENNVLFNYNASKQLVSKATPQYTTIGSNTINPTRIETYEYDARGNQNKITYGVSRGGFPVRYSEVTKVYDNVKPAPYLNSTLSKNNVIEEVETEYGLDGVTITTQSTDIWSYTYNEAGYVLLEKQNNDFSITYTLEKIN